MSQEDGVKVAPETVLKFQHDNMSLSEVTGISLALVDTRLGMAATK